MTSLAGGRLLLLAESLVWIDWPIWLAWLVWLVGHTSILWNWRGEGPHNLQKLLWFPIASCKDEICAADRSSRILGSGSNCLDCAVFLASVTLRNDGLGFLGFYFNKNMPPVWRCSCSWLCWPAVPEITACQFCFHRSFHASWNLMSLQIPLPLGFIQFYWLNEIGYCHGVLPSEFSFLVAWKYEMATFFE